MQDDVARELVLPRLEQVSRRNGYWIARCPAHDDDKASLTVTVGKDHPVVLKCFAGCAAEDIVIALGLTWTDVCEPREKRTGEWTPYGEAVAVYDYTDETGTLLFQVLRTAKKDFPQRVPDASKRSGWRWGTAGVRKVLYRLPKIINAIALGELIYIVEGEKDVHALEAAGAVATCPPGGSNAAVWLPEFSRVFEGAMVRIVADADKSGRAHARRVFGALEGVAAACEILEAATGKDASDHLAAGKTLADFLMTAQTGDEPADLAPDLYEFISGVDPAEDWVIRDLLERGDRLIWTSREGMGKSMVTRQFAAANAAGIQPFTDVIAKPLKSLFIDCENPLRKSRRQFRKLADIAAAKGVPIPEGMLRLIHRPEGINLCDEEEVEWLCERVTAHKPDLICIGPLYKLHAVDANEETSARAIVTALDKARSKADCGLVIEAHSPHGEVLRPVGSSLFMRWPEFGYGMKIWTPPKPDVPTRKIMQVEAWRGPRDERDWPERLRWGRGDREWPWVADKPDETEGAWWQ